jgi:hypothetical protein
MSLLRQGRRELWHEKSSKSTCHEEDDNCPNEFRAPKRVYDFLHEWRLPRRYFDA